MSKSRGELRGERKQQGEEERGGEGTLGRGLVAHVRVEGKGKGKRRGKGDDTGDEKGDEKGKERAERERGNG